MFLSSECYHRFHISCFKKYALNRLTTLKPTNSGEIQFEEAQCGHCHKAIAHNEISQMLTKVEMSQLEETLLNKRIELDPKMVRCECGSLIQFEPSQPDYKSKDEQG
jgi:hypothetical protein